MQKKTVSLQLAGRRFQVPCSESEEADLLLAARSVNHALGKGNAAQPLETRLLMLALNLSYELLQSDRFNKQLEAEVASSLRQVQRLMEEAQESES